MHFLVKIICNAFFIVKIISNTFFVEKLFFSDFSTFLYKRVYP